MYGNTNGVGLCDAKKTTPAAGVWHANYQYAMQMLRMNFLVCKIGTKKAATNKDVIIIPMK